MNSVYRKNRMEKEAHRICWYCVSATDTWVIKGVREIFCIKNEKWCSYLHLCEHHFNDPNQKETPEDHDSMFEPDPNDRRMARSTRFITYLDGQARWNKTTYSIDSEEKMGKMEKMGFMIDDKVFEAMKTIADYVEGSRPPVPAMPTTSAEDALNAIGKMIGLSENACCMKIHSTVRDMMDKPYSAELSQHKARVKWNELAHTTTLLGLFDDYRAFAANRDGKADIQTFNEIFGMIAEFALAAKRGGYKIGTGLGFSEPETK